MATAEVKALKPELSIVVPARNEEGRLTETIELLTAALGRDGRTEYIFVLDATSADRTVDVGTRLARTYRSLRPLTVNSKGKGGAVAVGVGAARGEIVVIADADLAVRPDDFGTLIAPARTGALAIASRSRPGSQRIGEPWTRYITGRLFNTAVRATILPGVRDSQCGFKGFRRAALEHVFADMQTEGWCFDVELIAQARRLGVPVIEVPVTWRYGHGSKMKPVRDAPAIARDLLRLRRRFGRVSGRSS